MAKKSTIEDLLKETEKREDLVNDYINSFRVHHNDAYKAGLEAVGGKVSKLKNAEDREKFVAAQSKTHIDQFKAEYGDKLKGDYADLKEDDVLHFMSGHTRDTLRSTVDQLKDSYTEPKHAEFKERHVKELEERHTPFIYRHIDEKHRDIIVSAAGYKGDKDALNNDALKSLFSTHYNLKRQRERTHERIASGK